MDLQAKLTDSEVSQNFLGLSKVLQRRSQFLLHVGTVPLTCFLLLFSYSNA